MTLPAEQSSDSMSNRRIEKNVLFSSLPPEWQEDLLPAIRQEVENSGLKILALDDDPTGTQTVRGIEVITRWDVDILTSVLMDPEPLAYILTNSRSYSLARAQDINREIVRNLKAASAAAQRRFSLISRSDSTLRGYFPGEIEALESELGEAIDGVLVIPFFEEGGRFTIGDVHYVAEGEFLLPAGETEYARDAVFGYRSSDLRRWVSEKYQGRLPVEEVCSIDLNTIRLGGPDAVAAALSKLENGRICAVNAASYRDLEVFVTGLLQAEKMGKRFLYRSAASFVRVRGGQGAHPLLSPAELGAMTGSGGGIVVAGSYIRKSSQQITALQSLPGLLSLEVSVPKLLGSGSRVEEILRTAALVNQALSAGEDVLIYTSRELVTGADAAQSLQIGQVVSESVIEIVRRTTVRPAWVVAKGGITSSDVATKGIDIQRADVLGQVLPGVPVWLAGAGSRWPGLVYVVFPGNVGGPDAIAEVVQKLRRSKRLD